ATNTRRTTPPCTRQKSREGRQYSQRKRRTQGKIAKKAGKMKIFLEACGNHRLNSGLRAIRTPSEQVRGVEVEGNSPILDGYPSFRADGQHGGRPQDHGRFREWRDRNRNGRRP